MKSSNPAKIVSVADRYVVPRISGRTMMIVAWIILCCALGLALYQGEVQGNDIPAHSWMAVPLSILAVITLKGMVDIKRGETEVVVTLFGIYMGTVAKSGWYWTNPFARLNIIPLKKRVLVVPGFFVADKSGASISASVKVVWRYQSCANAFFNDLQYQGVLMEMLNCVMHPSFEEALPNNMAVKGLLGEIIDQAPVIVWSIQESLQIRITERELPIEIIDVEIEKVKLRTNNEAFMSIGIEVCD
ncbi:hypothetical protein RYA05_00370 [Pseudomonas syringae pv. actinidiae]|nr:hypothetical protein [Pseudomonas syringae pv. actinidiae]